MKLGIMVDSLAPSQCTYFTILELNKLVQDPHNPAGLFFLDYHCPPMPCNFPQFQAIDAGLCSGKVVATSVDTATFLCALSRPKKIWYLWDVYIARKDFFKVQNLLNNDTILKVARCVDHQEYYKKRGFNVPHVVEDFNLKLIKEL